MKGDFTRNTFQPDKHYRSVRMQQGRVQLDADWNEQAEIYEHLDQIISKDIVGIQGTPINDSGFKISVINGADDFDLSISPGRIYVDGILCELEENATYWNQPDFINPPLITRPGISRVDLVYLDVWQRHITTIEDPDIKEVALGGPDTCTRIKTVWQVKLLENIRIVGCNKIPGFDMLIPPTNAQLSTRVDPTIISKDPCIIAPDSGYRGLENHLYRLEIHDVNDSGAATFKWSRDNGSVVFPIEEFNPSNSNEVKLKLLGQDQALTLHKGDWVEVLGDETELKGDPGTLARIETINERELTLSENVSTHEGEGHPKVRRWDNQKMSSAGLDGGIPVVENTWIDLEEGIQVCFNPGGTYNTGDYWVFAARTVTNDVEQLKSASPNGIIHHYCALTLVNWIENTSNIMVPAVKDYRQQFLPLNELTNEVIRRGKGKCTYLIAQSECWVDQLKDVVNNISKNNLNAKICFQVGEYKLSESITFENCGHIRISGCGPGTRIVASNAEIVFKFETCESVSIQGLYAESGMAGFKDNANLNHLNGTLTFCKCPTVVVKDVELRCAAGTRRDATCITVRPIQNGVQDTAQKSADLVKIRDCNLHVGHQQVGILLINTLRSIVESNQIQVDDESTKLTLDDLIKNNSYRSAIRKHIIRNVFLGESSSESPQSVYLETGQAKIRFNTHPDLTEVWNDYASINTEFRSDLDLLRNIKKVVDEALLNRGVVSGDQYQFKNFYDKLSEEHQIFGSQGVVVGGASARDVRILNNNIKGFVQGVHVGLSGVGDGKNEFESAGTVRVSDNNLEISLLLGVRDRHGIFIGNCDSLIVENNYVEVIRSNLASDMEIEGIRIYGYFGRMIVVKQNHLVSTNVGVRVVSLNTLENNSLWYVAYNIAPDADFVVDPEDEIQVKNNYS